MKSRLLLRRRRHLLTRPRHTQRRQEPIPVALRRLRKADAWAERVWKVVVVNQDKQST